MGLLGAVGLDWVSSFLKVESYKISPSSSTRMLPLLMFRAQIESSSSLTWFSSYKVSAMFVLLRRERAEQFQQPQPMLKAFDWFGSGSMDA